MVDAGGRNASQHRAGGVRHGNQGSWPRSGGSQMAAGGDSRNAVCVKVGN